MQEGQTGEEMAENLYYLIDMLSQQILKVDLSHIRAEEIIMGSPEMCIELLQLIHRLSLMMLEEEEGEGEEDLEEEELAELERL